MSPDDAGLRCREASWQQTVGVIGYTFRKTIPGRQVKLPLLDGSHLNRIEKKIKKFLNINPLFPTTHFLSNINSLLFLIYVTFLFSFLVFFYFTFSLFFSFDFSVFLFNTTFFILSFFSYF